MEGFLSAANVPDRLPPDTHVGTLVRFFAVTWRLYGETEFGRSPSYSREKIDDYIGPFGIARWIFKCFPIFPTPINPINPALFALGSLQVVSMYRKEYKISIL